MPPHPPRPPRPEVALGSPLRWTFGLLLVLVALPTVVWLGGLLAILLFAALIDPNFTVGEAFTNTFGWTFDWFAENSIALSVLIVSVVMVAMATLVCARSSRTVRTWEPLWQAAAAALVGSTLGLFLGGLVLAIAYAP